MMQAYVEYFQNVLGVREILLPSMAAEASPVRLAFLSDVETWNQEQSHEADELLIKMISAMKIEIEQTLHLPLSLSEVSTQIEWLESLPAIVVFSSKLYEFLSSNYPRMNLYCSPSLGDMLKNPVLKREAWETLKQVMAQLSRC